MNFKNPFFQQIKKEWGLAALVLTGSLLIVFILSTTDNSVKTKASIAPQTIDTLIPRGTNLIPIEVLNSQSVDPILGPFAYVDLYRPTPSGRRSNRIVATGVKLIRAPLDRRSFAVLVTEDQAPKLLAQGHEFYVVINSPEKSQTSQVKVPKTNKSRVTFEDMESDL